MHPSLPGFAFSTSLTNGKEKFVSMADRFHTLMTDVLGHRRFGVGAADYGALVGARLGHKYAGSPHGLHLGNEMLLNIFQGDRHWDLTGGAPIDRLPTGPRADMVDFVHTYVSHVAVHMLDGQTITHGLNDSRSGCSPGS
ncbi:MAG TPA: hypothetical protein VFG15_11915 [Amycolatopsis sp.]|nr:hypothetical protein [Amycolatopsis sp.]